MKPAFSRDEIRFVLLCCRTRLDATARDELNGLIDRIPTERLIAVMERHRMAPLVHLRLKQWRLTEALPEALRDHLSEASMNNMAMALRHLGLIKRIQTTLGDAVPFIPIKGVVFSCHQFGTPEARQCFDLDVLISQEDQASLEQALAEMGFASDQAGFFDEMMRRGPHHQSFATRNFKDVTCRHGDGSIVEIHWRLASNSRVLDIPVASLVRTGPVVQANDLNIRVLPANLELVYLLHHGSHHGWFRLKWLADLGPILDAPGRNWPEIIALAKEMGCLKSVLLGLALAETHLGWTAPPALRTAWSRQAGLAWQIRTVEKFIATTDEHFVVPNRRDHLIHRLFQFSLADNLKCLYGEISRYFLTPNDVLSCKLPDVCFCLYYPMRPLLFVWRQFLKIKT